MKSISMFAIIASILSIVFGCQPHPAPNHGPIVGEGITRAQGSIDAARVNISNTVPHADPVGKQFLGAGVTNLNDANKALDQALKDNDTERAERAKVEAANVKLAEQLKEEQGHILAKHGRDLLFTFCLIAFLIWAGLGIASFYLPSGLGIHVLDALPLSQVFRFLGPHLPGVAAVAPAVKA